MDEWINEMWSNHTMEYYLAIKRNEALMHAATWKDLENLLSKEVRYERPHILDSIHVNHPE